MVTMYLYMCYRCKAGYWGQYCEHSIPTGSSTAFNKHLKWTSSDSNWYRPSGFYNYQQRQNEANKFIFWTHESSLFYFEFASSKWTIYGYDNKDVAAAPTDYYTDSCPSGTLSCDPTQVTSWTQNSGLTAAQATDIHSGSQISLATSTSKLNNSCS